MFCSHWFNEGLTGRKRLSGRARLREQWDEEGWRLQADAEKAGHVENEVASPEPCGNKYGLI